MKLAASLFSSFSMTFIAVLFTTSAIQAQNVGVGTNAPEALFHVKSSGQVNTPGGLILLGLRSEGHMELDFNRLQSIYSNAAIPIPLLLQPDGGDVGIGTSIPDAPFHVKSGGQVNTAGGLVLLGNRLEAHMELDFNRMQSLFGVGAIPIPLLLQPDGGDIGIGVSLPTSRLHIAGNADQILTLHRTTSGAGKAGIDLLRHTNGSGTDWRIVNDGGEFKIFDGIDNFDTEGDLNLIMSTNGNLGLGTDSPQSHLHMAGTTDQFLTIHKTVAGSGMAGIDLLRSTSNSATDWRIANDGGTLKFFDATDNFDTDGDLDMVLTSAGKLGLGVSAPQAPLHVLGTQTISETGNGFMQIGTSNASHLRFDNNEILARNGDNSALLYLQYWSGNLSLCDDNNGRVGIGTSSPQAKVHITDGTDAELDAGGHLVLGSTGSTNLALDGNEIMARNNGAASSLYLQASGGNVMLIPNESGQVGIGITSPANLPSSNYLFAVDGSIIVEEVRVELSGNWPDYVFKDDYKLLSLETLEGNIKTLGHLPGMPSAAVVEDEGFDLGGTQRIMLEKIEELTLYLIDMNKEMSSMQQEIDILHEKNITLQTRIDGQKK
jgi:hypothetical protein